VAGDCWTSSDVAAACSDDGWLWPGVAWCRWSLALWPRHWSPTSPPQSPRCRPRRVPTLAPSLCAWETRFARPRRVHGSRPPERADGIPIEDLGIGGIPLRHDPPRPRGRAIGTYSPSARTCSAARPNPRAATAPAHKGDLALWCGVDAGTGCVDLSSSASPCLEVAAGVAPADRTSTRILWLPARVGAQARNRTDQEK
jgi:hypothetical protein